MSRQSPVQNMHWGSLAPHKPQSSCAAALPTREATCGGEQHYRGLPFCSCEVRSCLIVSQLLAGGGHVRSVCAHPERDPGLASRTPIVRGPAGHHVF